jgi:FSR family fosmidomycin resistance protein-like MFS transporter
MSEREPLSREALSDDVPLAVSSAPATLPGEGVPDDVDGSMESLDASPEGSSPTQASWRGISLMSFAHLVHDGYLGILGVLLPFIRAELAFSLLLAGFLGPAQQAGSLFQPLLGSLGDRFGTKRFVIGSVAVTGVAMSLVSISPSYSMILVLVFIGGLSSAVYHPTGSVLLTSQAGKRWGLALAVYSFGGNIGLAIGPLVATMILVHYGLSAVTLMAVPAVMIAGVLAMMLRRVREQPLTQRSSENGLSWALKEWRNLGLLAAIILGRAVGAGGLTLFLPTLLLSRGYSVSTVGLITTSYFAIGGVGGLLSGWLSDRFGRIRVMAVNMVIAPIAWFSFVNLEGGVAFVLLLLAAACLLGHQPVMTAMGQEMYPDRRGTIVGFTLGAGFVLQSIGSVAVGALAVMIGLASAFSYLAFAPLLALPALYLLHRELTRARTR